MGNCVNTVKTPSSQAVDMASPPSPHFSPEPSSSLNPPDTLPCLDSESSLPTVDLPATSSAYLLNSHTPENPQCPTETLPCRTSSGPSVELPTFSPVNESTFTWGSCDSATFTNSLNAAYDEAVHWRPNLFKVPYGKAGKSFVSELTRMYKAFATSSAMESIAMKAAVVLPILLLQKPSAKSKAKDHSACLQRRMITWLDGNLNDLVSEGRTIQQHFHKSRQKYSEQRLARSFANLMFEGKTKAAIRLLSEETKGGMLHLGDKVDTTTTVRDVLVDKHPPGQPAHPESLIDDVPPEVHPVLFESIDASMLRSAALRTTGAAGPSGLDAISWRRLYIFQVSLH